MARDYLTAYVQGWADGSSPALPGDHYDGLLLASLAGRVATTIDQHTRP